MSRQIESPEPDSPELQEYKEQCERSVNAMLPEITMLLKAHKIDRVVVTYQGGGDDGSIEDYSYERRKKDGSYEPVEVDIKFRKVPTAWGNESDQFEQLLYDILSKRGWEVNNCGSQGTFTWWVDQDMFVHQHMHNMYDNEVDTDNDGNPRDSEEFCTPIIEGENFTYYGLDDFANRWHQP